MNTPSTAKTQPTDQVVATLPGPRRGEEVRIALNDFRGRKFIALRVWWTNDEGVMLPSPKGINLRLDLLPALAEGIGKALEQARAQGLL